MQIVVPVIFDLDAPAFFAVVQLHVSRETLLQSILQMLQGRSKQGRGAGRTARWLLGAVFDEVICDEFFRSAHGQVSLDDFLREKELFIGRFEREKDLGVPDGNATLGKKALDLVMQIEQPHRVGDGRAALAHFLRDVFLP